MICYRFWREEDASEIVEDILYANLKQIIYTLITETIDKVYKYMHLWIIKKEINVEHTAIEFYYGSSPDITYMELWLPIVE